MSRFGPAFPLDQFRERWQQQWRATADTAGIPIVARGKPAPDIYLEAARRIGVQPLACVALEDSEAGTLAASRAGMRALLVPDFVPPSSDAIHAAFRVLRSLHDASIDELLGSS